MVRGEADTCSYPTGDAEYGVAQAVPHSPHSNNGTDQGAADYKITCGELDFRAARRTQDLLASYKGLRAEIFKFAGRLESTQIKTLSLNFRRRRTSLLYDVLAQLDFLNTAPLASRVGFKGHH